MKTNPCPDTNASLLSRLFYLWYGLFVWKGYRAPLTNNDLWDLNEIDSSKNQSQIFCKDWDAAQQTTTRQSKKVGSQTADIITILAKSHWTSFGIAGIMKLCQDTLAFINPQILRCLVRHVSADSTEKSWKGFFYAGIFLTTAILQTLAGDAHNKRMRVIGMRMRSALSSAIYKKVLRVSNTNSPVGEMVSLLTVDIQRLMNLTALVHTAWTSPLQIIIALYFLYDLLGVSTFYGVAILLLVIPINALLAAKSRKLQLAQMKFKDARVKLLNEFLSGIKVIKLHAWELLFQERVQNIRQQEMQLLKMSTFLQSSSTLTFCIIPFLISFVTFATYVLSSKHNNLNAEKIFAAVTLFNIITVPMTMFPKLGGLFVQASISVNRINKFLNTEEIDDTVFHIESTENSISIKNGYFSWDNNGLALANISMDIKKGKLIAVVGTVGAGKTSLLNAILGQMRRYHGHVNTQGSTAFVSQCAWIQNKSLRDNILFGDAFNEFKYRQVIEACALEPDLEMLPAGDLTEIGEKGINLSGGQKQRVSLARAAYKTADIYLFDDPLSALDSYVAKNIFDNVIGPNGMLLDKTRVLVTHSLAFLSQTDEIVVLKGGKIVECGTFEELVYKNGDITGFLTQHLTKVTVDDILTGETAEGEIIDRPNKNLRKSSIMDTKYYKKLAEAEKLEFVDAKMHIFLDYFKAGGIKKVLCAITCYVITQGASAYSNLWLAHWSTDATEDELSNHGKQDTRTTTFYLSGYFMLALVQAFCITTATINIALTCLKSATSLHARLLMRLLRAPLSHFDITPSGRLLNTAAGDVDIVDNVLPSYVQSFLYTSLSIIFVAGVISYSTPIFLIFIIPCGIFYLLLQRVYITTSGQLKRMENHSLSPLYSQFVETICGATTIRAFSLQKDFIEAFEQKVDESLQCSYPLIVSNSWVGVTLGCMGSVITFSATVFALMSRGSISPAIMGMSLSYALQITTTLNYFVGVATEMENNIVAVERIQELIKVIPQESEWMPSSDKKQRPDWIYSGAIEFRRYNARYRDGLDLVLRDITCSIRPAEKIGVVGRTGAGKSSLTLALFRLFEPASGTIYIDSVDISTIGLHELRSKITAVPQDPVLFSGSLRSNIDPLNKYSDDKVWHCLELTHMKPFVQSLPGGLVYEVGEGEHFSVGQRQLLLLSRALLLRTKILILDEATANVDLELDDLIQKTIRQELKASTVITIAHRLNTIMDCDRVIVLVNGEIKEFDMPYNLLQQYNSIFYGMAKEAGLVTI